MFLKRTLLAASALALAPAALAGEATTTRIETHAYYGATVTLEQGVRVFRPLPPHSKIIINPGGTTPINLGIEENRSTSHNHFYDHGARQAHPARDPAPAIFGGYAPYGHQPHYGARRFAPGHGGGK